MDFAKKKFGQNFITDKNLINKIINLLGEDSEQLIIEVGPGRGALTKELVKKYQKVIAVEIDSDMEVVLKNEIKEKNFELIIEDILEIDLIDLIDQNSNIKKVSIISNTPYYITSEIIFKTLYISQLLYKSIFMVQKEVAQRICAKQNEKNYNNLSIACQFYGDIKYEFTVNKNMFKPVPKVDSAIISMSFNQKNYNLVKDDKKFIAFVRKIFNNKRKTILNNLSNTLNNKELADKVLTKINIEKNLRPENISLEDFIIIYNEVNNGNN
ncbi:16S rRNA (adenine1518-N6/adenine1519-N6)-dimethyltransferase [Spiroplasma helicoides]|uniref:Ribosomal RNA small subunit methyltransferase A n=1 Tax=Spiroplasma helicoides TaxID=216938 RepID=A0A1B3SMD1_9MOLU|nr:16S rRNA (adenine(1518)-N(6)/adenine(1519)-N(6))-dimethyltransferase RsmA [Spiroplasma helicoides]AOG61088.1 16S rRNA (adenine1518-N6/adenine1519-N6)-dimethyltransferase [Spiroplasma helicoides]